MCNVYIYCLTLSMLLIRTYFCPVVVNPDFLQNHMELSLTLLIIHIFATIAVDDQYKALAANLLHTGRGRPPSQPKGIQYDNRLLVQLKTLRSEGQWPNMVFVTFCQNRSHISSMEVQFILS